MDHSLRQALAVFLELLILLALAVPLLSAPGVPSAEAASCEFVPGFATLHDVIPRIVGRCLENEHHKAGRQQASARPGSVEQRHSQVAQQAIGQRIDR